MISTKVNLKEIRAENLINNVGIPAISLFKNFFLHILALVSFVLITEIEGGCVGVREELFYAGNNFLLSGLLSDKGHH